jgi:predicted double-glycine peptidase
MKLRTRKRPVRRPRPVLRLDPSRTSGLRRGLSASLRRRFALLRGRIMTLVERGDSFGVRVVGNAATLLPVPVEMQDFNYDCGAACVVAVCRYFGVEPDTESEAIPALGTSPRDGTAPEAIVSVLQAHGLDAVAHAQLTLDGLAELVRSGLPVICAIQAYGTPAEYARNESGHYVVVTGVDDRVHYMDPSAGNRSQARADFLTVWHDIEADGSPSIRLGIAVRGAGAQPTANTRWAWQDVASKVRAFASWLAAQLRDLFRPGLTRGPVEAAFRRGLVRSYDEIHKPALAADASVYAGAKAQFLRQILSTPGTAAKVELLTHRAAADLDGILTAMSTGLVRVLGDGLLRGDAPQTLSRSLNAVVDGIGLRRGLAVAADLVRSHAEGQLEGFEQLGVEEVGGVAEWTTAGDGRICKACHAMEGIILPVEDAHGLIPRHSECRCVWRAVVKSPTPKASVDRAVQRSLAANPDWPGVANALSAELVEFSQFLARLGEADPVPSG